jgi:hypothetical protein
MKSRKERVFSVELKSQRNLKSITLTNGPNAIVLLEGNIGELVQAKFTEDIILEVAGKDGVLRIDLGKDEVLRTRETDLTEVKIDSTNYGKVGNSQVGRACSNSRSMVKRNGVSSSKKHVS